MVRAGQRLLKMGTFKGNNQLERVSFKKPVKARYFKLIALEEVNGNFFTTVGEIGVIM